MRLGSLGQGKQKWILYSLGIIVIIVGFLSYKRFSRTEGFSQISDILALIDKAQTKQTAFYQYFAWVGYMYKDPPTDSRALNDIKKRMFQPSCKFRQDWSTNLPPGTSRPIPAQTKDLANMAYKNYLDCLARPDGLCIASLADVRARFFEPGCEFLNPSDPSSYSQNFQAIFQ
jgi:hypothetical protein